MTIREINDAFTARWLSVLNSQDAGDRRRMRIIIAALVKAHGIPVNYPNGQMS